MRQGDTVPEDHARVLEGIERRLSQDDPHLAAALRAFAPPRTRRAVIWSCLRAALLGVGAGLAALGLLASTSAALHRAVPGAIRLR